MTRVLITGIAGFVGSHLVEHLQANSDAEIVGIASFRHAGDSLRTESFKDVKIFTHDLVAPISERLVERIGPIDIVINAAAESHVDRSIDDPRHFIENNTSLMVTMGEYARLVKPRVFIQVSTDEVYGSAPDGTAYAEWSSIVPSNPYSASKAAQEAIAISYWRTYDVPIVITNTMNMFGERQDTEKFIPQLIKRLATGKQVVIHGGSKRTGSRSYLHARNHADALMFIAGIVPARYSTGADVPDRYNIAGEREITNLDMAVKLSAIMRTRLDWKYVDFHKSRPGHDLRYALDDSLLKGLGWQPPLGLDESLERTIAWTLEHPEWLR